MKLSNKIGNTIEKESIQLQQCIITTKFQINSTSYIKKTCQAFLFKNKITIKLEGQLSEEYLEIGFQFELKCILYQKTNCSEVLEDCDEICYIKLFKDDSYLEFRKPERLEDYRIWKQILQRNLMQFGFYENYTPINQLGQGNFAKIFLVQNNTNREYSALKTFSKQCQYQKQNGKKSFLNQISIMKMFNHNNITKINEVYENDQSLLICIQLLSGGTLTDKINLKPKFNSLQVKAIMKSLLLGVEQMHKKKIMHRDLKPDNILFRYYESYECVIGDFGLAEHVDNQDRIFKTCGTPGFVAPEVLNAKKGEYYDQACDIFSLGIILHLILLGKLPFSGQTVDELFESNRKCQINFNQFQYHQLPQTWLKFLKSLLQIDPTQRLTATEALAHNFFKKQPLIKKIPGKNRKKSSEPYELDIENTINILEFDEILRKKEKKWTRVFRIIQSDAKVSQKQNKSEQKQQVQSKSIKSINSSKNSSKNSIKSALQQNTLKRCHKRQTKVQSKFRGIALNHS